MCLYWLTLAGVCGLRIARHICHVRIVPCFPWRMQLEPLASRHLVVYVEPLDRTTVARAGIMCGAKADEKLEDEQEHARSQDAPRSPR